MFAKIAAFKRDLFIEALITAEATDPKSLPADMQAACETAFTLNPDPGAIGNKVLDRYDVRARLTAIAHVVAAGAAGITVTKAALLAAAVASGMQQVEGERLINDTFDEVFDAFER